MVETSTPAREARQTAGARIFRWLAIAVAALWMFQAATGILLTYHFELNDKLISDIEAPADFDAIEARMERIEATGGEAKVNWIWSTAGMPGRFQMNYTSADGDARIARIAGDGSVLLDTAENETTFLESIRNAHLALGAGKTGEWILAITGIILLVYLARSLRRAWPRDESWSQVLGARGGDDRLRSWYRALTLWGAVPAFIVVLAAVVIHFEHQIEGPIGAPPITLPEVQPEGEGVGFAAAARAAEEAIPGSRFVGSPMPTSQDASYKAWVNQPGEMFREEGYGGSLVIVDGNDGSVRGAWPLQEADAAYTAIALPYPVHTGEIAGPIGRFLVLLAGLWLFVWAGLTLLFKLRNRETA